MRQTKLSLTAIRKCLNGRRSSRYPRCALINELGEIARFSSAHSAEAQKLLVDLLAGDSENDQWIAIRHLKDIQMAGVATPDTMSAVAAFESDESNAHIIPRPEELMLFCSSN